jgi:hypothetical protein
MLGRASHASEFAGRRVALNGRPGSLDECLHACGADYALPDVSVALQLVAERGMRAAQHPAAGAEAQRRRADSAIILRVI